MNMDKEIKIKGSQEIIIKKISFEFLFKVFRAWLNSWSFTIKTEDPTINIIQANK